MSFKKKFFIKQIFPMMLSIGLLGTGCGSNQETTPVTNKANPAKLVKVQPAATRTMIDQLKLPGSLRAENIANILSTSEGRISGLLVREGDRVRPDQVLATISSLLRDDIINSAQLLIQGKKTALAKNPEDAKLRQESDQAEADYQFALQQYREIPVTSPISGVVSQRWVDLGDMIPAKARLFEIQSSGKLQADVFVSEQDIGKLKPGQPVEISADAYPERKFNGVIQRIHPQVDLQTRNGKVEIRLTDADPNLLAGMFVRVMFVTQKLENVVAIPVEAVIERPRHRTCFIVKEQKAEEKIIQTGLESNGWVEIKTGLSAGEQVVVEGQQQLKTGMPVKIMGVTKDAGDSK